MKLKKESLLDTGRKHSVMFYFSVIFLSIIVIINTLYYDTSLEYKYLFLLPLSYLIIIVVFSKLYLKPPYKYGMIFYVSQIFLFIRYVVTPFTIVNTIEYTPGPKPALNDYHLAIILMIYELVIIFIVISITIHKNKEKKMHIENRNTFENNFIVILFIFLFLGILANVPGSIIPEQMLFLDDEFTPENEFHGSIEIISLIFKITLFLFLASLVKKVNIIKSDLLKVIISLILIVMFLASLTSTSRWTLIFMGLASLFFIERNYPNYKQIIRFTILPVLIVSFISISLYKFSWVVTDSTTPIKDILFHMSTQFQAYFSGPRTVAQSINIKEVFPNISLSTLINDFLGSIPYVSNYIDQNDRINVYFNIYNYREFSQTLIMPLVGIGYTYFGFIFAPIFTAISQFIVIKLDAYTNRSKKLEFVFIYTYLGLRLSMSVGLNTQSLFTSFIIPTLPLLIIYYLNQKIVLKRQKNWSR